MIVNKILPLELPCVPRFKCGVDSVLTGIGIGASALFGAGELAMNEDAMSTNLMENEKNRRFNSEEADKQRKWQSEEWQRQYDQQVAQWYKQYDYNQQQSYNYWLKEQEYSTPENQIKRLNVAGLNANAIMGSNSVGGLAPAASIPSSPTPVTTSVPSGASASVGMNNPVSPSGSAQMLSSIGSFVSDISKVYVENSKLRPEIDMILANVKNQELLSEGIRLDNAFKSLSLGHRVEKAKNEMLQSTIAISIMKSQKENINEDTLLKLQQRHKAASDILLNEMLSNKADVESALLYKEWVSYDERLANQLAIGKSEQARNYAAASDYSASAALHKAVALVYHDEHAEFVYNRLVRGLDDNGNPTNLHFFNQERESYRQSLIESINKSEMSEYQKTQCKLAADKLQKDVDWYEFNMIVGEIGTIAGAATGAVFAGAAVGRAGSLGRLAEEQAKKLERSAGGWSALGYRGNDRRFSDGRYH